MSQPTSDNADSSIAKTNEGNALTYYRYANNQLIERASTGLVLQGVLIDINEEITLQPRAKLITIEGDAQFVNPSHQGIDRTEEFKSQTKESRFKKVVEKFGSNISASAEGNALINCLKISGDFNVTKNQGRDATEEVTDSKETSYYSQVQYAVVPTVTCILTDNQIRIDGAAFEDLKAIHMQLNQVGYESEVTNTCRRFFKTYGSHILLGKVTFGGIYLMSAFLSDFSESQKAEAKKAVSDKIATEFKLAVSIIAKGNAVLEQTSSTDEQTTNQQSNIASQVRLETKRFGGSPQAENLQDWKRSLVENANSWAVIGRDDLRLLGIWEIICRHYAHEFESPQKLAELLHAEWMKISGLKTDFRYFMDEIGKVRDRINNLLQNQIPQWLTDQEVPAIEHLKELVKLRREVEETVNNKAYWGQEFLSNVVVYNYLKYVRYNNNFNEAAKKLMRQLLTSDDALNMRDYTQYKDVFDWINKLEDNDKIIVPDIHDVDALIKLILQLKQLMIEDQINGGLTQVSEEKMAKCNKYLVLAILSLRSELRKQDELSEAALLVLLLSLGYIPSLNIFQKNLKSEEYQKLADILKEDKEQPLGIEHQVGHGEKREAHLLLKVLDSRALIFEKEKMIEFINTVLRPKLKSPSLQSILTRYNVGISYECADARKEIEAVINPKEIPLNTNNDLSAIFKQLEEISSSGEKTGTLPAPQTPDPILDNLLKDLRLSQYYPNKLGREEVYTITRYSLTENPSRKPEELSLYYRTNLLALNHQARWLKTNNKEVKSSESEEEWWLGNSDGDESSNKDIHPLDVMAATFLCCHPIIHQDLVVKLWECKLAIPLVIQESGENHAPKFFLWAMRALVMRWKKTQEGQIRSEERTIADYPMETVTFIRFDQAEISKSALLNSVMFGNNPHDMFFHKDSEGSNQNRQLAEGMVELAWHLPEGNQKNKNDVSLQDDGSNQNDFELEDITAFANLRGDARKYPRQLELIKRISSHVVIFTSSNQLEDSAVQVVRGLLAAGKAVILLLTNKRIQEEDKTRVRHLMANFQDGCERITFISIVGKSQPEIRDEVRNKLKTMKPTANSKISLADLAKVMQEQGMEVDEEESFCQQGINQAAKILELVRQHPKEQRKAELLPLQSKWWKEWAQADKEVVRQKQKAATESSSEYAKKQNERKAHSRRQQIEMIQQHRLPSVTQLLLKALFEKEPQVREYFVRQLKLGLDALSRAELPDLYAAYGEKMKQLGQYQTSPESAKSESETAKTDAQRAQELQARDKINHELKEIDEKITAQSFGLEHLLREIGQVYLAMKGIEPRDREQEELYQKLPRIAADLLLSGYPLEIMDGEVSSVPLEWVQAVLKEFTRLVQQQGTENPRIFALSAMGIQSSGKSTLLNVMFGLQFAVSAGRCTKGIYLQPVKLASELREQLQVDYIFVVDTEGIKSPEQSLESETGHDNELSSFVIGLSDLSLIKVSGENSEYLKDILPISVQAFLRMNQVNLKPRTKIVHRNVDTSSTEKLDRQNVKLNTSLDEYTAFACKEERQPLQLFRDIIEFDLKKDVEYLGTLYRGVAARNPIDPDYSKSVKRLTSKIIYGISHKNISSIDKFVQHLENLWDAVKRENFVYEFKNTIEIQARNKLNTFLNKVVQEFSKQCASLVTEAYTEISSCDSVANLSTLVNRYEQELSSLLEKTWQAEKQKIEQFFAEPDGQHENVMQKWKASTDNDLDELRRDHKRKARQRIQEYQDSRLAELKRRKSSRSYSEKFTQRITNYVKQKKQGKSEAEFLTIEKPELRQKFEELWVELLHEIPPNNLQQAQVLIEAEAILRSSYSDISHRIIQSKGNKSLKDCQVKDFKITDRYYHAQLWQKLKNPHENDILKLQQGIEELKNDLLNSLKDELDVRQENLDPYEANYLRKFLDQAHTKFEEKSKNLSGWLNATGFSLTRECKADLFMIICGEAIRRLEEIDQLWREAQDPTITMNKEKESLWQLFLTMFNSANLKNAVVGTLLNIIQQGIVKKIKNELPDKVADIRHTPKYSKFFRSKQSLIASIMIDLADEPEHINDYIEYINYPKTAIKKWIERNIDDYNSDGEGIGGIIKDSINTLIKTAEHTIKQTNTSIQTSSEDSRSISDYTNKFSQLKGNSLIIDNLERVNLLGDQFPKEHFIFPDDEISKELEKVKQELLKTAELNEFSQVTTQQYEKLRNQVAERIMDDILGCVEACPFCGEICSLSGKNHSGTPHATLNNIHRPQGVARYRSINTGKLITDICSQLIAGNSQFKNQDTNDQWKPYKQYRDVYPNWDIKGDFSVKAEDYWKWFMYKYYTVLARKYDAEEPEIPSDWKLITKEQATEKLRLIVDGKG